MSIKFNDNLKKLRKKAGLTQKQLSNMLKVALSTVAMWETGNRQPDYSTLNRIAAFFNVSFDTLLSGEEEKPLLGDVLISYEDDGEVETIRDLLRTRPEMKMLFSASKNATKQDIERTVAIIEALKSQKESK